MCCRTKHLYFVLSVAIMSAICLLFICNNKYFIIFQSTVCCLFSVSVCLKPLFAHCRPKCESVLTVGGEEEEEEEVQEEEQEEEVEGTAPAQILPQLLLLPPLQSNDSYFQLLWLKPFFELSKEVDTLYCFLHKSRDRDRKG